MKNKAHLTEEGLDKIEEIRCGMNRSRKEGLWEHVSHRGAVVARYFRVYTWCTIFVSLGGFNFGFDTGM